GGIPDVNKLPRIQGRIAQELVQVAMPLIVAGFGNRAENSSERTAVRRVVGVGHYLKLLHGLYSQQRPRRTRGNVAVRVGHISTIEKVRIVLPATTRDAKTSAIALRSSLGVDERLIHPWG